MGNRKIYEADQDGIRFRSERKAWGVSIPAYVYDLWMPLIGSDAVGVLGVYYRLERDGEISGMTMKRIATACRIGTDKLGKINDMLVDYGFIRLEKPTGWQKRQHYTTTIITLDPPQEVPTGLIPEGYKPLAEWLVSGDLSLIEEAIPDPENEGDPEPIQVLDEDQENPNGFLNQKPEQVGEENLNGSVNIILNPLSIESSSIESSISNAREKDHVGDWGEKEDSLNHEISASSARLTGGETTTLEETSLTTTSADKPHNTPTPPSPPAPKITNVNLYAQEPVSDELFATLGKTDQRTAIFSIVCWKSYKRDPKDVKRGGRQDKAVGALLSAYPDLKPRELHLAYVAYYRAYAGVEMVKAPEKLVDMAGEWREKGVIESPLSDERPTGKNKKPVHDPNSVPNWGDLLAREDTARNLEHYHVDAIRKMAVPERFLAGVERFLEREHRNALSVYNLQELWKVYQRKLEKEGTPENG